MQTSEPLSSSCSVTGVPPKSALNDTISLSAERSGVYPLVLETYRDCLHVLLALAALRMNPLLQQREVRLIGGARHRFPWRAATCRTVPLPEICLPGQRQAWRVGDPNDFSIGGGIHQKLIVLQGETVAEFGGGARDACLQKYAWLDEAKNNAHTS